MGLETTVMTMDSVSHMRVTLRRLVAQHAPRVAVAGGDGTVEIAAQEVAHSGTALGIIPLGTFNNFAAALGLPNDLPAALKTLKDGAEQAVDLGKIGDRYFTEAAGVGVFADWLSAYGRDPTKRILRILSTVAHIAASYRAHRIRLVADGQLVIERAVLCTVANTWRTATAVPIAPEARLNDGKLDVVIVGDLKRGELLPYFRALLAKRLVELPKVTGLRAAHILIESSHRMRVHADDQIVTTTPVRIEATPHALKVIVPSAAP